GARPPRRFRCLGSSVRGFLLEHLLRMAYGTRWCVPGVSHELSRIVDLASVGRPTQRDADRVEQLSDDVLSGRPGAIPSHSRGVGRPGCVPRWRAPLRGTTSRLPRVTPVYSRLRASMAWCCVITGMTRRDLRSPGSC